VYPFTEEEECLSFARTHPADLAILDMKLKKMSGIDVLEELKNISPEIKVMMLTGYPSLETARESLSLGAVEYCVKPIDKDELESKVAEILGHELTRRRDLIRDEPNHPRAHEEYFKIQVGPIQRLENPIPAGDWKRITFFYTTGEQFQTARTINDLVIKAQDEREVLWHTLRERALKANEYQAANLPNSVIDPAILALLGEFGAF